jgi:predicted metalloendopeptidase
VPAARAAIGDCGLDLAAGDHNVRPGDDFFAYASGGWYGSFDIPADHSSYGPFNALEELSTRRVRTLIEAAAAAHPAAGTPEQQIGDYFASFMDSQTIEANCLSPAQADLKRIADATTREELARLFALPARPSPWVDRPRQRGPGVWRKLPQSRQRQQKRRRARQRAPGSPWRACQRKP